MKKLLIVLSSVRPNRIADKVLTEVNKELENHQGFESKVFDFREQPLPFFDGASSPAAPGFEAADENAAAWIKAVNEADAVLVLTAEYNHSYTGVLKNAIDWLPGPIVENKRFAFIGYGWVGGARAITRLRGLLTDFLDADPVETEANLAFTKEIDLEGNVLDSKATSTAINDVLAAIN